ncbi:MAG TPA: DUF6265 family protein [Solimonas sp.]|nr:DUF6265 family protein [Solimonas sp.]
MRKLGLLLAGALLASSAGAQTARVDQFAWLAGCWGFDTPDGRYEEQWTTPTGNSMLGVSRRVADGFTKEFEFMRIVTSGGGGFDFTAQPNDGPVGRFNMLTLTGTKVVFERPENEFPKKVIYEFVPPASLNARIEGVSGGHPMGLNFPMKKKACP